MLKICRPGRNAGLAGRRDATCGSQQDTVVLPGREVQPGDRSISSNPAIGASPPQAPCADRAAVLRQSRLFRRLSRNLVTRRNSEAGDGAGYHRLPQELTVDPAT
jgi:hypothetical protein